MTSQYDSRRVRLKRIEEMLQEKPMTKSEVAAVTGYSRASVWGCFHNLIYRRRIYVADWDKSRKGYIEKFGFGALPDVPKPIYGNDDDEDEVVFKRPRVVVKIWSDPYLWLSAGRAIA